MIGYWLDLYDSHVGEMLSLGRPEAVVVGIGAWGHIPAIHDDCGTNPAIIMRWTEVDEKYDPKMVANGIYQARQLFPNYYVIAYGLNEEPPPDSDELIARRVVWELAFVEECHRLGLPAICLNLAVGNPGGSPSDVARIAEKLRPVHDASDYVGPHFYDILQPDGTWMDPTWTAYRYRLWPSWFDRGKLISTEVGVDGVEKVGSQNPGWRARGLLEEEVTERMLTHAQQWKEDGLAGTIWFLLNGLDAKWDPYRPTRRMVEAFGGLRLPMRIKHKEKEDMAEYNRSQVWADYQRKLASTPMFQKVRAANPQLGDALGPEYDRGDYRFQDYAGGIVWALIGEWDKAAIATKEDELPLA
jgi:hypothetical protein